MRSTIPIPGVGDVAFFAVQIGVYPRGRFAVQGLDSGVRRVPVVVSIPPQRGEFGAAVRRRLRPRQTGLKFVKRRHLELVTQIRRHRTPNLSGQPALAVDESAGLANRSGAAILLRTRS